jgi:hypothetical protein
MVRYDTRTMEILGSFPYEKIVRCSTLSYRIAIVRVLWHTIAQIPGTVRLWFCMHADRALLQCTPRGTMWGSVLIVLS